MSLLPHQLELLSPAKTAAIGREAILHGADAVYIGGPSFGARHNAGNSVSDIAELVGFAHRYHARIFVTLNIILHEAELEPARQLIHQLYDAGVDALIIQDMGLLELDLPPIQLHASTQCDIRSADKARFLADCGFSQLVLARELSLPDIRQIHQQVNPGCDPAKPSRQSAPADYTALEYFVHGALCVAFSGQCYISHAQTGRSANRGDCSQACRLPFTLQDQQGRVVAYEKHLLSMKDNNQSANIAALIEAGVRSFKIEGRYKEAPYVKNITAHYRQLLDEYLNAHPDFAPASSGRSEIFFTPNPDKTFHRGSTDYFATGRQQDIGAFDSPTFVGVPLGEVHKLGKHWLEIATEQSMSNGDGLNYLHKRQVVGLQANTVEKAGKNSEGIPLWRVFPNETMDALPGLKPGLLIQRNRDHAWDQALLKKSAERTVGVTLSLHDDVIGMGDDGKTSVQLTLALCDEDGIRSETRSTLTLEEARDAERAASSTRDALGKLGNTLFHLATSVAPAVSLTLSRPWFIPVGALNALRREACAAHEQARLAAWPRPTRKAAVEPPAIYPDTSLSYLANVYNSAATTFYAKHGVQLVELAYEAHQEDGDVSLMITKHCLRFSFNLCPKQAKGVQGVMGQIRAEPMTLVNGKETLTLTFDCRRCEMHVKGKIKKHILQAPPPSDVPSQTAQVVQFYRKRP